MHAHSNTSTLARTLTRALTPHSYNGFPVVRNQGGRDVFVGLIKRDLVLQTLQVLYTPPHTHTHTLPI